MQEMASGDHRDRQQVAAIEIPTVDGDRIDLRLVVRRDEPRPAKGSVVTKVQTFGALGGALLGARILVDVEDQVVRGGVADLEVERGELLQLAP